MTANPNSRTLEPGLGTFTGPIALHANGTAGAVSGQNLYLGTIPPRSVVVLVLDPTGGAGQLDFSLAANAGHLATLGA